MFSFESNRYRGLSENLNFLLLVLVILVIMGANVCAQPTGVSITSTGKFLNWEREERDLSEKIAKAKLSNQFLDQYYVERSNLYLFVAAASNGGDYGHGEKALPGEDLFRKAIADLTHAIKLKPTFSNYAQRSNAHFNYWMNSLRGFNADGEGRFYNAGFFKNKKVLRNLPTAYQMVEKHFRDALADYNLALQAAQKNPQTDWPEFKAQMYYGIGALYSGRYLILESHLRQLEEQLSNGGGSKLINQKRIFVEFYPKRLLESEVDQAIINFTKAVKSAKREGYYDFKNKYSLQIDDGLRINRDRKAQLALARADYDTAIEMFSANLKTIVAFDYDRTDQRTDRYGALLGERGQAFMGKKDYDLALRDFSEGINKNSRCLKCLGGRIKIYEMRGELEKALADYPEYVSLLPRNKELEPIVKQSEDKLLMLAADLAKDYEQKGQLQNAIDKWTVIIEKSGYVKDRLSLRRHAYERRAALSRKLGKVAEAIEDEQELMQN